MMINNDQNNVCVKCGDVSGRQFTCNGCQQSFCWKHMTDHSLDIQKQMDVLSQNDDLLKHDWNDDSHHNQLFNQIDQWEKDSIDKIQKNADLARNQLRIFINQSKDNLKTTIKQISEQIDKSQQSNNYSEIDINQWTQQLKNIHSQIQKSFYIQIQQDEQTSPITLIKIKQNTKHQLDENEQTVKRSRNEMNNNVSTNNDRFYEVFGEALLQNQNLVVINDIFSRSFISGTNLYSIGKHCLHFRIEKVQKTGSSCFFGMMTSNEQMNEPVYEMESVYGVWSSGYNVECGQRSDSDRNKRWKEKDYVTLTFDCDNKQFHIENKQINWCQVFDIDLHLCPFPWKFLTIMKGCKLRIENRS